MEKSYKDFRMFCRKPMKLDKSKSAIMKIENNELITDEQSIAVEFKSILQEIIVQQK